MFFCFLVSECHLPSARIDEVVRCSFSGVRRTKKSWLTTPLRAAPSQVRGTGTRNHGSYVSGSTHYPRRHVSQQQPITAVGPVFGRVKRTRLQWRHARKASEQFGRGFNITPSRNSWQWYWILIFFLQEIGAKFVSAKPTSSFGRRQFSRPTNFLGGKISYQQFIRFYQKPAVDL